MSENQAKKKTTTRKTGAFTLFEQGFGPNSPEVKALGLKYDTRKVYYVMWLKSKEAKAGASNAVVLAEEQIGGYDEVGKKFPKKDMVEELPGKEEVGGYDEIKEQQKEPEKSTVPFDIALKEGDSEGRDSEGGVPTIPETIIGWGLPIRVKLSVKTLALYQIALTAKEANNGGKEKLALGDFLDDCVTDYFVGRGMDLGLVIEGGKNGK